MPTFTYRSRLFVEVKRCRELRQAFAFNRMKLAQALNRRCVTKGSSTSSANLGADAGDDDQTAWLRATSAHRAIRGRVAKLQLSLYR